MLMNKYHILYYYQSIVSDRMVFRYELSVTHDHGYVPFIVFKTPTIHLQNKIRYTVNCSLVYIVLQRYEFFLIGLGYEC